MRVKNASSGSRGHDFQKRDRTRYKSMGESNTIVHVSTYTLYRHLQKYLLSPIEILINCCSLVRAQHFKQFYQQKQGVL